jgi:hypothetical protein
LISYQHDITYSHLAVLKFKMEGLDTLSKMLKPDDYMFTVDLQNGYYHVNMHDSAIPYLEFQWKGCFYTYKVLLFGLAISPLVFSKVLPAVGKEVEISFNQEVQLVPLGSMHRSY